MFFFKKTHEVVRKEMNLILDFHVRWNSVYLMLNRLKKFKDIVNLITTQPSKIPGLSSQQKASLIGLKLTIGEWEFVECLFYVLAHFTKLLKCYQDFIFSFCNSKNAT